MALTNPYIIQKSEDVCDFEEGCLSMPGVYAVVTRPAAVTVRYQDFDGNWVEEEVDEFVARIIQHEIDHLNGILFTDYLDADKRKAVLRNLDIHEDGKQKIT